MPRKIPNSPETRFKKGTSGNPNGRPRKLPALDAIIADVLGQETNGISVAQQILNALKIKAKKGDIRAAEALLNRGYGLPKQSLEVSGALTVLWNEEKTYEAKPETNAGA
jgi:hypothetical protein